jgi:hypothetical protein
MADNNLKDGSVETGSPIGNGPTNPNALGGSVGQPSTGPDYKAQYEELESKMGPMGQELGDYRKFFEGVAPLLDKLDQSPQLVQAIMEGRIDADLAKAALEGKISIAEAAVVTQASEEVKKELGKKALASTSTDDINRLIEEKAATIRQDLEAKMKEDKDERDFEAKVNDFISNTPDFEDYAKDINEWLDKHDVTDIQVAYYAVKGELSEREARKKAQEAEGEGQKGLAANAAGGGSLGTTIVGGEDLVDTLIAGRSNPNLF